MFLFFGSQVAASARALLLVGGTVGGDEVQRIVGQVLPLLRGQLLGALLPGVPERHHVVDLDGLAGVRPAPESPRRAPCTGPWNVPDGDLALGALGEAHAARSRRRMSLRVSQPFRSASSQAWPKADAVIVVFGCPALDRPGFQGRARRSPAAPGKRRHHRLHPGAVKDRRLGWGRQRQVQRPRTGRP